MNFVFLIINYFIRIWAIYVSILVTNCFLINCSLTSAYIPVISNYFVFLCTLMTTCYLSYYNYGLTTKLGFVELSYLWFSLLVKNIRRVLSFGRNPDDGDNTWLRFILLSSYLTCFFFLYLPLGKTLYFMSVFTVLAGNPFGWLGYACKFIIGAVVIDFLFLYTAVQSPVCRQLLIDSIGADNFIKYIGNHPGSKLRGAFSKQTAGYVLSGFTGLIGDTLLGDYRAGQYADRCEKLGESMDHQVYKELATPYFQTIIQYGSTKVDSWVSRLSK